MKTEQKQLEILVIEDTPEHLEEAKRVSRLYKNVHFTFVSTEVEAEALYGSCDGIASDIFFPRTKETKPTFECGINAGSHAKELDLPLAYCTAGKSAHAREYDEFLDLYFQIFDGYVGFGSRPFFYSYSENPNEIPRKSWKSAFDYLLLKAAAASMTADSLDAQQYKLLENLFSGAIFDRGQFQKQIDGMMNENLSDEEALGGENGPYLTRTYGEDTCKRTLDFIRETIRTYRN